jgi:hypothetical protein
MHQDFAPPRRSGGQLLFLITLAVLAGFLTGRSLAEAAGMASLETSSQPLSRLNTGEAPWVFLAIGLMGLFVFALGRFLLGLTLQVIGLLRQIQARPAPWVAVLLIVGGVVCFLAAVVLQWHAASASATVTLSGPDLAEIRGQIRPGAGQPANFPRMDVSGAIGMQSRVPLMVPVTTLVVLLAGAMLVALGIWSSIPPRTARLAGIPAVAAAAPTGTAFQEFRSP